MSLTRSAFTSCKPNAPDAEYIIPFLFAISCYIYNIYLYLYIFIYIYIYFIYSFIYLCIYLEYVQHAVEIRPTSCTGVLLQRNLLDTRFGHDQFFTIFCLIIVSYLSMISSVSARLFSCKCTRMHPRKNSGGAYVQNSEMYDR